MSDGRVNSILVTGGCGFIGSNYIRQRLDGDDTIQIHNYDTLTYAGNLENLTDIQDDPRYSFHRGDVTDRKKLDGLFASHSIDAVVHFAAESHVDRSILDSGPFVQSNIVGTQVLLDASRAAGVTRYVQVSTDEVYGSLGPTGAFTESTPLTPNSPYSASKAAADLLVRSYCQTFDFPAIITRCSNNYGPFQFPEKIIPLFVANAMRDEALPVYGTGTNVRDWIHVDDHCRGIHLALERGQTGHVYNFGGRTELTNIELTKRILRSLDKPDTLIKYVTDRPGHDQRYAIDCTKAEEHLGWLPNVSFDEGLLQTIRWYQDNESWCDRVRSGEYRDYYERQYKGRMDA